VTPPERPGRRAVTRADLPDEFTPESVRRLGFRTIRQLSQPGNGILTADEQASFDTALRDVMQPTARRLDASLRRAQGGGPGNLDPQMRRSFARTQQRLAEQARRARESFPELTTDWDPATGEAPPPSASPPDAPTDTEVTTDESLGSFEDDVEQATTTLEMLERIADIQQHQLEHQESQLLSETRGIFFAFLVSVAVLVAGVAPLVEAEARDRWLILLWTLVSIVVAGVGYALVRMKQSKD
jgi:hypothetical protein